MSTTDSTNGLHQTLWCGHALGKFGPEALTVAQGRAMPFLGNLLTP